MNTVTLCEACGHELRLLPDCSGRVLHCPGCLGRLRVSVARPSATSPHRGRRLGLVLVSVVALALPAAIGATKIHWSIGPPPNEQGYSPSHPPGGQTPASPSNDLGKSVSGQGSSAPSDPAPVRHEHQLVIPAAVDSHLEIPTTPPPAKGPRLVSRLPASLAFAVDSVRNLLLSACVDGILRWFDAETLRPGGSCVLPGHAYQLVCDGPRRKLYAALSDPNKLQFGPLGDRLAAVGDIHVFDLDALLALTPADGPATTSKRIPCGAHVGSMCLSPDRESLYFLAEINQEVQIARIDVLDRHEPKVLHLGVGGVQILSLAPDGKTMFGLAGGRLFALDIATWSFRWTMLVGGNIVGLAAGPAEQIYLIERRLSLFLVVVDSTTQKVVSRTALGLEGRPYLCRSADGRRVYFSNSAVTTGQILAFEADPGEPRRLRLAGWARSDRAHLVQGGICLSDDGRFLLTGVGQLYRVGS